MTTLNNLEWQEAFLLWIWWLQKEVDLSTEKRIRECLITSQICKTVSNHATRQREASKQINISLVRKEEIKLHCETWMYCFVWVEKLKESPELSLVDIGYKTTTKIMHHIHQQQMSRKRKYVVTVSKMLGI